MKTAELKELSTIIDKVLFGLEDGDSVISIENDNYKISNKTSHTKGLIEQLQIGVGNNLNINSIVAKKLRDGLVGGIEAFYTEKENVSKNIKEVKAEEETNAKESKKEDTVIANIADDLGEKPTKAKTKSKVETKKVKGK